MSPAEDESSPAPMDIAPMGTQRVVLAELFTGAWCGHCPIANQALGMVESNFERDEVVCLAWHHGDILAFTEGDNRISWVGISGYPTAVFDGVLREVGDGGGLNAVYNRYVGRINTRSAIASPLRMTTEWEFDQQTGDGEVWVNITAVDAPSASSLKLHTVVFENDYGPYNGGNGENYHNFVARDILESEGASGATLSISQGETKYFHYTFDVSSYAQDLDKIGIIAFVQAHDASKEVLQASYVNVPVLPNVPPEISFGQTVVPAGADEDDDVTFKVFYRDLDDYKNNGPSEAKVYYKNGTSPEVSANLQTVPSGDPYTIGKWLAFTTKLPQGTYTYRFSANDGEDDATGDTGWNATQFTILPRNKVPRLSENAFSPAIGDTTQVFRFSVLYMDMDNEAPTEAKIYIDTVGYDMTTDSTGPWAAWVTYYYDTTLSVGSNHRYYFTFSDGEANVRLPRVDDSPNWLLGPEVESPNGPPTLTTALATPDEGTRADEFTFSVIYTDGEDDHPISSLVFIDGVAYIMSTSSTTYVGGALYKYRTPLSLGDHEFHFAFDDGKNQVRYPMSGDLPGPTVVNLDPVAKITSPVDGSRFTPDDYVSFNAMQSDDPDLDQLSFAWTSSIDGPLGTLGSFDKMLTRGVHTITLTAADDYGGSSTASVTITVEPRLPHVFIASVASEPTDPIEGDVIKYTVTLNNDGEARAQGVDVLFLVDGTQVSFEPVSVEMGIGIDVRFTWKSEAGQHTITIEVGEETESLTESVATNTLPTVDASVSGEGGLTDNFEVGTSVFFDVDTNDADGDEVTYLWDFGDGMTSTQPNPTHTYTDPNTYTVRVTVTDARGGVTYKEMTVTVVKPPSEDSPGFGALLMATAMIAAVLAALVRRED